jgi:hypothetical protein
MNRNTLQVSRDESGFNSKTSGEPNKKDLNAQLTELQAAHKGMHPVLLTVLAALQGISDNEENFHEKIQS